MLKTDRFNGFILIDTLVALSILAMVLSLFWYSRHEQLRFERLIERDFAFYRLQYDLSLLTKLNALESFKVDAYEPVEFDPSTDYRQLITKIGILVGD